jgi:preprotein translocase subunit SecA
VVIVERFGYRGVENAQKKVEQQNFSIRKRLLEYDDVMNRQREVVYGIRQRALAGETMREEVLEYIDQIVEEHVDRHADGEEPFREPALHAIAGELALLFIAPMPVDEILGEEGEHPGRQAVIDHFVEYCRAAYERRENDWGSEITREVERRVMLFVLDEKWRDHLYEMDMLKEGIGLRAYAQKDPLVEYKKEAFTTFGAMMDTVGEDVVRRFFRVSLVQQPGPGSGGTGAVRAPEPARAAAPAPTAMRAEHSAYNAFGRSESGGAGAAASAPSGEPREPVKVGAKVGRNDPCPCGSGRKYKKCHGAT